MLTNDSQDDVALEPGWSKTVFMRSEPASPDKTHPMRHITGRIYLCADHTRARTAPTDHDGESTPEIVIHPHRTLTRTTPDA